MEKSLSRPRLHSSRSKTQRNPPHPQPSHPKALYDDVFGAPPRYGVPFLYPRTEDYLEIFGSFHIPSRSCSRVPFLDLPVAEADQVLMEVRGGGFDYSEVFGRVEGGDVGLLEFEVVSRSDDVGESSCGDVGVDDGYDHAWTPEASDCLSEDSEICGYDQTFSNGKPYVSVDGEIKYKMSFHKANHGTTPFDDARHASQIQSIPGFSYVVGETPGIEKNVNPSESKRQISNSNLHLDYGMERVKGKEQKKVLLHSSSAISRGKSNDDDSIPQKQIERVKAFPGETFVTISEINLRTVPSNLPPPSRPPPAFGIKTSNARGSTSIRRKNSPERDCLPDCFDVDVDGASSAAASAATMRKAMDEAQSQLNSAKGSMERRKDCLLGPEMSGTKSDPNYMTKKGTLFVNSTCSQKNSIFQYDHHRVNNGAESSVTDKSRNIYGENRDEVMKGKVVEGAVRSDQIWQKKKGPTVHSEFVGDDRTDGACYYSGGYDFFSQSKKSDQGSGIREGMLGEEVFDMKVNGLKSREWREARNLEERKVENKFVMIKEKEKGVEVMEVSERKDLKKNEAIQKHSNTKHSYMVPQTAPPNIETHAGRSATVGVKNQGSLHAVGGYVGVFDSVIRHTLEHVNDDGDLMVSESYAQFQEIQESLLHEKTHKEVVDQEEYERGPRADAQLSVVHNEEKMASGSDGSAEWTMHYVANDASKENVIEQVQNDDRLHAVVEQEKVKVLLAEHYPKERAELEDTRESAKGDSKLNPHKSEDGHKEANQQNGRSKVKEDFSKNGEEIPLNWAVEQKENDCRTVNLSEREEMEKMLKTAFPRQEKKKISSTAYQMEEGEMELNEATELEDIGNCSLESCRNSSTYESAPEQGIINESLKEDVKYVHTKETLAPKHEKANILERENAGQHEEAVNESDDDIGWEIIDGGLCEVVDVTELVFLNQAREKIPVHEVSVPHYSADGQFDLENSSNSETRTEAIAPQVNRHDVQTEDGFNSATTELTELMDERASRHSERDLKSKRPGSDFFKSAETVHEEYVYSGLMGRETAVTADQTIMEQETVEFKDDSELSDVLLHQGKEISTSSKLNSEFDCGTIGDASLPHLVDGTAQNEEKKEKRAIPEARDNVRLSREQEADLERLRRIEEEKEREKEREKDRMVIDKAAIEARERAISEAREGFEKATVERATAEARRRAMMEARERLEKACAEARERLCSEKSAAEERLRLERAAVERAIVEARGRAAERAKADRSASDKLSSPIYSDNRHTSLSSDNKVSGEAKSSGSVEVESAQRCRARLERHQRTAERVTKALAEKNMQDLLAQREQAERSRLAETLDADVRRWSKGKEGNLRALLSTLQYILGPDSGWQPIPLTEVITLAAMKKAYRKATLCVHPDKLQQRGASIQQKYICEKVFDLLKEGWNKFNSEER